MYGGLCVEDVGRDVFALQHKPQRVGKGEAARCRATSSNWYPYSFAVKSHVPTLHG